MAKKRASAKAGKRRAGRGAKGGAGAVRQAGGRGRQRQALAPVGEHLNPQQTAVMRELFWQNVIREILTSLSTVAVLRPSRAPRDGPAEHSGADLPIVDAETESPSTPAQHQQAIEASPGPRYQPELFDGRLAVMLKSGERVPIGDVFPVFACGVSGGELNRPLAMAVECSVFQIRTPEGQVFTVPLHEIRGFHALTPELMRRLMEAAEKQNLRSRNVPEQIPFGFAAFTSLAKGSTPIVIPEAPAHPTE